MRKIVGITGGIASGKSIVSHYLRELGFLVVDCDIISQDSLVKDGPCYGKTIEAFGTEILNSDGSINRRMLGDIIFNNQQKRFLLNSIIHPYVKSVVSKEIIASYDDLIFVDIPLLYESEMDNFCDLVWLVYVPFDIQMKRLIKRDNITAAYAKAKISSQMSLELKRSLADYVIDNSFEVEKTLRAVDELLIKMEVTYELYIGDKGKKH